MKWVTCERPKIDRLACPWLIKRFIDTAAEILYVPAGQVLTIAAEEGAIAFDVPGVELTHSGPLCSFDAFVGKYRLKDAALAKLAQIVRAADTDTLDKSAQAPGLLAISLGLGANIADDQELLKAALPIYDALYTWPVAARRAARPAGNDCDGDACVTCVRRICEPHSITRRDLGRAAMLTWLSSMAYPEQGCAAFSMGKSVGGEHWRGDFPALDQHVNGYPLTYLDSAATTHRPRQVLAAMNAFYEHDNANPGSTLHTLARRTYERYEGARSTIGRFLNAAEPEEVVWVRGTTEGINLVATAWARPLLQKGDEILLTVAEHASNLLPWRMVAEQTGASVRFVDVDDDGRVLLEDLDRKLSERTRLFAFTHVSNVTGYVNPAEQMCARARAAGARVLIDAAQSAPHIALDVQRLGCDFLVFSGHKMLGPMGVGVVWARRELLDSMPPYQAGSNMAHEIDFASQEFEHAARKFGAGTPNVAGAVGLAAAVQYLSGQARGVMEAHEAQLTRYTLERLTQIPGLRLLGPKEPTGRVPVFSFVLEKYAPQVVQRHLDSRGIAIRAGDLAALPLLRRSGVTAAARASCYLYTRTADIDRLCLALLELTRERAKELG